MKRTFIVRSGHVSIVLALVYPGVGVGVRKPNLATMSSLRLNYLSGVAISSSTSHAGLSRLAHSLLATATVNLSLLLCVSQGQPTGSGKLLQ
ncbi:hypothetical protein BDZ90DRAFT_232292 [Jaminaea rosea]|uniref:Uncharacterized protein n=1 Tax=Jaminaea rosea TaxID=1569628 RepID=A0A316UPT2_9BASI|nr:hypothetical protein BDZ90DRAFT_232292 [Jaminaea rosea]PWN27307.1 hypothetical protein BDZ90DRAFT_232292 [Jaminaea rosea]